MSDATSPDVELRDASPADERRHKSASEPRVAVVTGAGRGIGRATALALAARGLDVALLSRTAAELEEAHALVTRFGTRVLCIECDVASSEAMNDARDRVVAGLGPPEVVVCCAGIVKRAPVTEMTDADFDEVLRVNLYGVFYAARAFTPFMIARKNGRFVVVSSISATLGSPQQSAYAASKWGVDGFMKSLAEELRGTGVSAMSVRPGSVDTKMLEGSGFEPKMTAEDVAQFLVYVALDAPTALHASAIDMFGA